MHQQVQHNESSTLHTLTPPDDLSRGLVKAVKVALNEKYEIFPRKIGALLTYAPCSTHGREASHSVCRHRTGKGLLWLLHLHPPLPTPARMIPVSCVLALGCPVGAATSCHR